MGFPGLYWAFTRLYRVSPSLTGVKLGLRRFLRVLLGFTEFFRGHMEERRYRSSLPVFLTGTIDNKRKEKEETITAGTQAQHPKNGSHSYSTLCAQKRKSHKYFQPNPSGRRKKSNQINARLLCASGSSGSFRYSIAVPEFDFSLLLIYFLSFLCVWPTNSRSTFSAFVSSIFLTRDSSISTKKSRFGLDLANTSHHLISVAFFLETA